MNKDSPIQKLPARNLRVAVLCLLLVIAVAVLDVTTPLGVAAAALYSPIIAASLLIDDPRLTRVITGLSVILILLGGFISPESTVPTWISVLNRALYIVVLLITALLVIYRQRDARHIHYQQQRLEAANRELALQALRDGLTGVANRRAFDIQLREECARARRNGQPLSLLMVDVDHFKRYNDAAGHQAGDAVLKGVADAIRNTLRRPVDMVARYGGEEFAIILPVTAEDGARERAEEIRRAVRALGIPHPGLVPGEILTVSTGVGTQHPPVSPESLIQLADQALYRAKSGGRDQVASTTE